MKKWLCKAMATALALCLCITGMGLTALSSNSPKEPSVKSATQLAARMAGNTEERVDEVTVAGRTCYMYVPESTRIGNFLGLTPIVVVFGNEAFTAESALAAARGKGFADLAQRDGLCILFANPVESWDSTADAAAADALYTSIYSTYSSRPDVVFVNGKGTITDTESGKSRTVYPGSIHGLQMFACGKGADYVATNYLVANTFDAYYALQTFPNASGTPSGIALFAPSTLTVPEKDVTVIPMAVVNGPQNAQAFADAYNAGAGVSKVITQEGLVGFDAKLVTNLYEEVTSKFYYSQGQFRVSPKYAANGIVELNDTKTVSTGKAIEYYTYIPADLDLSVKGSVPMMLWYHGMGGEAEAMLSWTEWPEIAKEDGLIVVSVDQHWSMNAPDQSLTAPEMMELLDLIIADYPYIDTTRIYSSGFSAGSAKTWEIALKNWDRFAGIIPCALGVFNADPSYASAIEAGGILPTFYLAGGLSPFERGAAAYTQNALKLLWTQNSLGDYVYDAALGEWGVTPSTTVRMPYRDDADMALKEESRQQVLSIDAFASADGNTYTWLAVNENKPHTITNNDAHVAWEYIKKFSRNADGTIAIAKEAPSKLRETLTASMTGNAAARMDEITVAGRTCYMYVPKSVRVGNFLCLTPIVVVLDDKAFTAESALATAQQKGFASIAERDGLCILFANPAESWDSKADADAAQALFAGIFNTYSSRPDVKFVNGKGTITNAESGQSRTVYPGSLHGLQFFGCGKGADYIAANYTTPKTFDSNYAIQTFNGLSGTPSGMALFAPSTLTPAKSPATVIPIAIVNGPENAAEFAASYQTHAGIYELVNENVTDFRADLVINLYDSIVSKFYSSMGQLRDAPKNTTSGIIEVNNKKTTAAGKVIEYYEYIPEDLDTSVRGSIPLLLWFHGGGGEAEAMVSWTEWPLVAQENGFVVISMDQHQGYSSHEAIEVLDQILAERTFLDSTRVYAGGFSMGGGKTWNLAAKYWDRLAGVIPTAAGTMKEGSDVLSSFVKMDVVLPAVYVAGGISPLPELPNAKANNVNEMLGYLWDMNRMATGFEYDGSNASRWGMTPSSVLTTPFLDKCDHIVSATAESLIVSQFPSVDGNTYTYLCVNANKSHTLTGNDAYVAWEYIKHFSRNADGSISIDDKVVKDVTKLPFADVAVDDWFYNAVKKAYKQKLMYGAESIFAPNEKLTRGQLIAILYRAAGAPEASGSSKFSDVKQGIYYRSAVIWGEANGIVYGKTETSFAPDELVTREEMYAFLYRCAKYLELDVSISKSINEFADSADASGFAAEALAWAYAEGYLTGSPANGVLHLDPKGNATRAQAASVMTRFVEM